jgi:hypothetical protein
MYGSLSNVVNSSLFGIFVRLFRFPVCDIRFLLRGSLLSFQLCCSQSKNTDFSVRVPTSLLRGVVDAYCLQSEASI